VGVAPEGSRRSAVDYDRTPSSSLGHRPCQRDARSPRARATGGAWKAAEMAGAGGARAWVGDTHAMVIDAAGNVFKGPLTGGAVQFGLVDGRIGVTGWSGLPQAF
jgi:hypothetical protein